jgi:hypothetical protein
MVGDQVGVGSAGVGMWRVGSTGSLLTAASNFAIDDRFSSRVEVLRRYIWLKKPEVENVIFDRYWIWAGLGEVKLCESGTMEG